MSKPPGRTRQRVGSLLNTAQLGGNTAMMRDWMPAAERTAAVAVPGRSEATSCRYCGVSTKPCALLFELLRKPSYDKKKKDLFLPPIVARPPSPKRGK